VTGAIDPASIWPDGGTGDESWSMSTPVATFPEGSYMIRIECFRQAENLHYALHQEKIYVNR
jgi:hypothetical protein